MAAANTDATKGLLMLHLHERATQDAWVMGMLYANMTLAGHGKDATTAIDLGYNEGDMERKRTRGSGPDAKVPTQIPPARLF